MSAISVSVIVSLLASASLPVVVRPCLDRFGALDVPSARSSHLNASLRGAGLGVGLAIVAGLVTFEVLSSASEMLIWVLVGVTVAVGVLGSLEDFIGLSVAIRASSQFVIGIGAAWLAVDVTGAAWGWVVPAGIAIAAYINFANFMDGLNGMSGLHGLVSGGIFAVAGLLAGAGWLALCGLVVAAAFVAFLPWNLSLGNYFLGDVGSYILGGVLAAMAVAGFLASIHIGAMVGPLIIYLADTVVTMLSRVRRGERLTEPHRSHVYQRLTNTGLSHIGASLVVAISGLLTGAIGLLSLSGVFAVQLLVVPLWLVVVALYLGSPAIAVRRMDGRRMRVQEPGM